MVLKLQSYVFSDMNPMMRVYSADLKHSVSVASYLTVGHVPKSLGRGKLRRVLEMVKGSSRSGINIQPKSNAGKRVRGKRQEVRPKDKDNYYYLGQR